MSKLSDLKRRIHTLGEIKSILSAMKNLSIIEMNKVSRFLENQQKTSRAVEEAISDFQDFYGNPQALKDATGTLFVLVGSERGFCGSFNESILSALREASKGLEDFHILAIGRKLASKLGEDLRFGEVLDGPNTAEEISGVIMELFEKLAAYPDLKWTILFNDGMEYHSKSSVLIPFERLPSIPGRGYVFAPLIQMSPSELYPQLLEEYLYFLLYRVFYSSFMAENRQRLQHMEGAIQTLERDWGRLLLRFNGLRQEEITEELEIILLNTG